MFCDQGSANFSGAILFLIMKLKLQFPQGRVCESKRQELREETEVKDERNDVKRPPRTLPLKSSHYGRTTVALWGQVRKL